MQVDHQKYPHPHHNIPVHPQQVPGEFSFSSRNMQGSHQAIPLTNNNINEGKTVNCFGIDEQNEQEYPWRRMKWTDGMVKLLITALSYLTDDTSPDFAGGRTRDLIIIAKKGKWKAISKIFSERGFTVSPQQCEDKFNDLNKKYRRLVEILGRGTSCEVVENPNLLEFMNICENLKDEVRKLLSVKQFFYREMCSYHNGNRLFLPHDETLRNSLKSILKGKQNADEDAEGNLVVNAVSSKRRKQEEGEEDGALCECVGDEVGVQERRIIAHSIRLEREKLRVQTQMVELKKEELKWRSICRHGDSVLKKLRLENAFLELENARLSYELKLQEISDGNK